MSCVSELILRTSGCPTTSMIPRGYCSLHTVYLRKIGRAQCMNFLGGTGRVAVHAKHAIRSCGGTTRSPRGTTLVEQPLEVCNTNSETQDTRYQPIVFRSSNLFYIKIVRFRIWVPYQNFIY